MDSVGQKNNIYVGNRYVPIFADPVEWNNLREYEPLTIVTYQGTSYTSKQTVPVGTALSNKDYWVVTGNYNAQVQQLADNVEELTDDYNTFKTTTSNNFTSVNNNIASINNNITNLQAEKRGVILIGDSYSVQPTNNGWIDEAIATKPNNITAFTKGQGGAGFVHRGQNPTFLELITQLAASITDKSIITDVIVMGGYNDATCLHDKSATQNDITSAVINFCRYVKNTFPNCATVYCGMIGFTLDFSACNSMDLYFTKYAYEQARTTYTNFVSIVGASSFYMQSPQYYTDGQHHPSEIGNENLARKIWGVLNGGNVYLNLDNQTTTLIMSGGDVTGSIPLYYSIHDGIARFQNSNVQYTANAAVTTNQLGLSSVTNNPSANNADFHKTIIQVPLIQYTDNGQGKWTSGFFQILPTSAQLVFSSEIHIDANTNIRLFYINGTGTVGV